MRKQKIMVPKIKFLEDSLLIDNEILVFGDLHMGYEDTLTGKGVFPRRQLKDTIEKLNNIFFSLNMKARKIKQIIILGDLKHKFGEISDAEWRETIKLLDFLIKQCKKIILIKGNHDNILGPIAQKKEVKLKNYHKIKNICFLHGDKLYKNCLGNCNIIIMGHLHPVISLNDKYKREKYKCFLVGKWKRKRAYVLPSFGKTSFGYDLRSDKGRKKFLIIDDKNLKKFKVIIYNYKERKEYNFGKLKKLV